MFCCVAYQAGIFVVITLAAVYAEQVMGFQQTETMMLVFLVNIAAALGAFFWQDSRPNRRSPGACHHLTVVDTDGSDRGFGAEQRGVLDCC